MPFTKGCLPSESERKTAFFYTPIINPNGLPVTRYSPCCLLTLAAESRTLCLLALTGGSAGNSDVLCMADTVLIKGTFLCLAGNTCLLCWIIHGALIIALASLPKAAAAGVFGMLCVIALYLNVILAAALFFVIHAACYGTV